MHCGSLESYRRSDDEESIVTKRFHDYETMITPILDYYRPRGITYDIDGTRSVNEITQSIRKIITDKQNKLS